MIDSSRPAPEHSAAGAIASAASQVVHTIGARAIVAFTASGSTALRVARERPDSPVIGLTPLLDTARRMAVVWGVHAVVVPEVAKPAIAPKKSITNDYLICLEDGRKFKSLKRHLRTQYNLSPEEYREKWGLASDYPMVAPAYAKARSALAKQMGLGQQRRRRK